MMSETNPTLQRWLGYTGRELAQMHYTDVTHPDDQDSRQQIELDAGGPGRICARQALPP